MIAYDKALAAVLATLAIENGCQVEDVAAQTVRVFERPSDRGERAPRVRRYPPHEPAFAAVSIGRGAVISASRRLLPDIEPIFRDADRDQVFEVRRLSAVNVILAPFAQQAGGPHLRLLCGHDTLRRRELPAGCRISIETWPSPERLRELGAAAWPHAISSRSDAARPTAALALAWRQDQVIGVAAISDECEQLWQIGIDVAEPFRRQGIGAALTAALAGHALDLGKVPWYGVAPTNLASTATALAAGFRLAWSEVFTSPA